jgi:RNA polymerase sigma-32 factor
MTASKTKKTTPKKSVPLKAAKTSKKKPPKMTKSELNDERSSSKPVKTVNAEIVDDSVDFKTVDDFDVDTASEQVEIDDTAAAASQLPVLVSKGSKSVTTLDPLTMYLREIQKYPVLSRDEEKKVATKYYETKDAASAELLVRSNLRFVVKIAAEYAKFSAKMIDLIQEGNVGLMHAVKEYNPYKGNRLITYAVWWIRGYIQEYLMRQFSLVRIGTTANQRKLFYELRRQKEELEKMNSPEKIKQLSLQMGIPEDEVREMAKRMSFRDVSLDKPVDSDEDSVSLGSLLKKTDGTVPIDEQLALAEQIENLKDAIERVRPNLSEKEKIILEERVLNDEPLTLQEIGEKYKITREAVRQNEVRLINKIKKELGLLVP